jgi:hypothetical protein
MFMWGRSIGAERALLGAVLLDPAGQHQVLGLVQPDDMRRPWHAQVLAAMQRARGRGALPDPAEVYRELQNDPDLPRGVARDAVLLASLMEAAPQARHAPAYAAMVVEAGIRQRLYLAGSRMVQASETGELEAAWRQIAYARAELDACATRWLALPGHLRRLPPGDTAATAGAEGEQRAGGRRARPRGDAAVAAGATALRDLAAAPSQLAGMSRWLRPEHFARPRDGVLYAVMRDMDEAGMPVDPVTVTWEAARRGIRADPRSLGGGTGAFAPASAREVYRHGVLAGVAQTGRDIQAGATSPGWSPGRLMQQAGDRLRTVEARPQPGAVPERASRIPVPDHAAPARRAIRHQGRQSGQPLAPQPARQPEREAAP